MLTVTDNPCLTTFNTCHYGNQHSTHKNVINLIHFFVTNQVLWLYEEYPW